MPGFGDQRIGFVCHGENQVVLFPASALVGVQHGKTVKQMPGVYHKGGKCHSDPSGTAGQKRNGYILHGTGVNEHAHGQSPTDSVAVLIHQYSKSESQEQISGHNRQGIQKNG